MAGLGALLCAATFGGTLTGRTTKAPPRPKHPKLAPELRAAAIRPAAAGELRLTPTFTSVGLVWGSSAEVADLHAEWRAVGAEKWSRSEMAAPWFDDVKNHRASIWGLAENTDYEVRLVAGGETRAAGRVKTWASAVPVARTVDVSSATDFPIVISEKGSPDGWVRVTAKDGRIAAPVTASSAILVTNAAYVVFDDLVITGGDQAGLLVVDSSHVRVRACDISGWGSDGYLPRYDQRGALFKGWSAAKNRYTGGNHSGGIDLAAGATGVVVERCFIHAPRSRAHSWRYSHPYGPMAIRLRDSGGNHVIRWNDLVGSDRHRFDDAIGGGNDFYELGTFNRESDVYGNFVAFANDDCLEIDGGQQNVRVFGNRFEAGYMGVSVQGAIVSPSYVFDNLFSGCADEFDGAAASIKTSGIDLFDYRPFVAIFDNVFWGRGHAVPLTKQTARLNVWRNRCYGPEQAIFGLDERSPHTTLGVNETNLVAVSAPSGDWPRRPIPYVTDISRLDGIRLAPGTAAPIERTVTLACGGADYAQPFKVVTNGDADFLSVTPSAGVISSGRSLVFAVRLDPAKMTGRRHFRTAFLIRTADGFSRAVTVYAETDFVQPFACEKPGEIAVYAPVDPAAPYRTYGFDVPQDGRYYFMVRTRGRVNVCAAVDDEKPDVFKREVAPFSAWHILAPGGTYMDWARHYDLTKGRHTLTFAPARKDGAFVLEGLVLTDHPGSFEPDAAKFEPFALKMSSLSSGTSRTTKKGSAEK